MQVYSEEDIKWLKENDLQSYLQISRVVFLTEDEIAHAKKIAQLRQNESISLGYKNAYGHSTDIEKGLETNEDGCLCEAAVCKFLGIPYTKGEFRGDDAGPYQVRGTRHLNGRLILHHRDYDDKKYILVINEEPYFTLYGWIFAKDGKKEEFWTDPTNNNRPAFFVPQSELDTDVESLKYFTA